MMPLHSLKMRAGCFAAVLMASAFAAACDNGPLPVTTVTTAPTVTSPVTESFSSSLSVGGYAYRSITAAKAGTITVTLASTGTSTTVKLGLALGIPDAFGSSCLYNQSKETTAGGSLSASVDASGAYCVRIYDLGTLTAATPFTVTIVRP